MKIETIVPNKPNTYFLTLSAPGTIIGTTVSAIVFTTLNTTGEVVAAVTSIGIGLTGTILAYGTELAVGSFAADSIRGIARTYSAVARPTICNTSRMGALGISILAGTGAAFTTSALIYGGKQTTKYMYSFYEYAKQTLSDSIEDYKLKIANRNQYPISTIEDIELLDISNDNYELIKDS